MAFRLYSTNDGHVPAWEYYECSAIQPQVGMGMALNDSGQLAASATPEFICMRQEEVPVEAGTKIPVVRIAEDQIWESVLYSEAASAKVGLKCDVDAGGMWPNAKATTNANVEITYLAGTKMGDVCRVKFVK